MMESRAMTRLLEGAKYLEGNQQEAWTGLQMKQGKEGWKSSFSQLPCDVGGKIIDQERGIGKRWGLGI